ncbi:MAG TPA: KEOPS complex subunit Cgi121 [Candidatus Bathyarchaeia archaeon]|nr:KEOPS complex subunit Cgi121 [Candidatus Bathyarchaeia archaeon]
MIDEVDHHFLLVLGFPEARVNDPASAIHQLRSGAGDAQVQLVKADLVAGVEHVKLSAAHALRSFYGKKPRSKSLAIELLLFISCQRQISKAVKELGVETSDKRILLVALSDSKDVLQVLERDSKSMFGETDDRLIEIGSKRKLASLQRSYGVSNRELEASRFEGESVADVLKRSIIERSALLSVID